eukprot:SAG31_NODE_11034_length_1072_cov_1.428571_1_plen_101_part_00
MGELPLDASAYLAGLSIAPIYLDVAEHSFPAGVAQTFVRSAIFGVFATFNRIAAYTMITARGSCTRRHIAVPGDHKDTFHSMSNKYHTLESRQVGGNAAE